MSEILCRWLNEDVQLSKYVDPNNFAECFANGYLLGELLHRNGLQDNFELFSQLGTSDTKLSNFTRIQPTMALLEVKFNTNMAEQIINEEPGVATRLLYQLFIALGKKNKLNLTGVAMETMRPKAAARLGVIETDMYKERLKTLVPRQVDLDFDELVAKYNRKQKEQEDQALKARLKEEESIKKVQQDTRQKDLQRSRQIREKQEAMMVKIKEATVKIPEPPEQKKHGKTKQEIKKEKEIRNLYADINNFEKSLKSVRAISSPQSSEQIREIDADIELFLNESPNNEIKRKDFVKPEDNDDYVLKIRQRLNEDINARKEREKRRRRVLVEQMKVHEAQQNFVHEEILVNRLMSQSKVERRIAVQLMNIRQQKDVIKQHRYEREIQYTERRMKDFQDALDRETEMCRQAKVDYSAEIKRTQELHNLIAKERALKKYEKHYDFCKQVVLDIIDFSCKFGEYRELTEKLLPPKIVREWKTLFMNAKPLYEAPPSEITAEEIERLSIEESKKELLDEEDFLDYQNHVGEWRPQIENAQVAENNAVIGFVLKRLNDILYPPTPPPSAPLFPAFPIKACVLGKCFSGKTSAVQDIIQTHRIEGLNIETAVHFAIQAWENKEYVDIPEIGESIVLNENEVEQVEQVDAVTEDNITPKQLDAEKVTLDPATPMENKEIKYDAQPPTNVPDEPEPIKSTPLSAANTIRNDTEQTNESGMSLVKTESSKTLTLRARLGGKACNYLKKGRVLPDALLVDIMIERIRNIPDGTGWILDGFPTSLQQAKLLERGLTGYSPIPSPQKDQRKDKKGKKSKLAADPQPPPEVKHPKSGIDVLILFEIENEVALKRAEGRKLNPETNEEYHEEFNPPPDGCYTGLQKKTKVKSIIDESNDKEQIQVRLVSFTDNWPKMEKWLSRFNIMKTMKADISYDELHLKLKDILNETLAKLVAAAVEEETKVEESVEPPAEEVITPADATTSEVSVDIPKVEEKEVEKTPTPKDTKKGGKKGKDSPSPKAGKKGKDSPSPKRGKGSPAEKRGKGKDKERTPSPPKSRGGGRKSAESPKAGRPKSSRPRSGRPKSSKSNITSTESTEQVIEDPLKPSSPIPGSKEWVYVDKLIDKEFVEIILSNWDIVEDSYIASTKHAFRMIRLEDETIYRYFYETRKNFVEFLKRPDEKQVFVTEWQKNYNKFPEDMRTDDEAKSELHQRVDDLCDRLWDICDNRKEEAENECNIIINERWLEDHIGILINHFISLMQMEVDRFQQTCKMMKDYYVAMEGGVGPQKLKLISDGLPNFLRVPLVELPVTSPPTVVDENAAEEESHQSYAALPTASVKLKTTPAPTPLPVPDIDEKKARIPLVPRRPRSGETSPSRAEKKKSAAKKENRTGDEETSPTPSFDLDEKLIFDAATTALNVIDVQNSSDLADDEADANLKGDKPAELVKVASKDKKKKKGEKDRKTPSKTSRVNVLPVSTAPSGTSVESMSSEEDKENKILVEKMKKEYKRAVQTEGINLRIRIDAIKDHSIYVVKKLKEKAQQTYKDMDDWLGKRFSEEMKSIDKMCEVIRQAIEEERQIQDASVLEDKEFFIDDDLHIFKSPTPERTPSPREDVYVDIFTCAQLAALVKQFKEIAPDGLLSIKSFTTVISELQSSAVGLESLPEKWMSLSNSQVEQLGSILAIKNQYLNWKFLILLLSSPYPIASQEDLLDDLNKFHVLDIANTNHITKEEYNQISIWLDVQSEDEILEDSYDRTHNLKQVFFDVCCVETSEGYLLNYEDMLLYFAGSEDPFVGLMTALSIVMGRQVFDSSFLNGEEKELESIQDQSELWKIEVKIDEWIKVFSHGESVHGGDHRFNVGSTSSEEYSRETFVNIYNELGFSESNAVSLHLLYSHPIMRDIIDSCVKYQLKDINRIFDAVEEETIEQV